MNPVCRTAVPVARGERDSATLIVVRATAAIPISTFTKKIRRQDRPEVSTPPISGPMTTPRAGHRSPHPERDAAVLAAEGVSQQRREHDRRFVTSWTACCRPVPTVARTRS